MKKEHIIITEQLVNGNRTFIGKDIKHNITVIGRNQQAVITRLAEAYKTALQALHDNDLI